MIASGQDVNTCRSQPTTVVAFYIQVTHSVCRLALGTRYVVCYSVNDSTVDVLPLKRVHSYSGTGVPCAMRVFICSFYSLYPLDLATCHAMVLNCSRYRFNTLLELRYTASGQDTARE
jgi:hypothetical protein